MDRLRRIGIAAAMKIAVVVSAAMVPSAYGNQELTITDLTSHLVSFRVDAAIDPQAALTFYAEPAAAVRLSDLGRVLTPITDAHSGWQFFFSTSIAAVTSLTDKIALTMFYNPWADVALLCEWKNPDGTPRLSDAELVTGDILRKTKTQILTPLWRREGDVPPPLAVTVAASDTVKAFLDIYGKRPLFGAANWRGKIPNLKSKQQIEGNRAAVGALFSQAMAGINVFFTEDVFSPIRESMGQVRQLLLDGHTDKVLASAPEITPEARMILTEMPIRWEEAMLVSLVTDANNAFVFVAGDESPEFFVCFWFAMEEDGRRPALRRIDFLGHNLSFDEVDRIARQAGMKR